MKQAPFYQTFTSENFQEEVEESHLPVLVKFSASYCGSCHILGPALRQAVADFSQEVKVGKLDVTQHPEIAEKYGIQTTPFLLFFRDGQVVDHISGPLPKSELIEKIRNFIQQSAADQKS